MVKVDTVIIQCGTLVTSYDRAISQFNIEIMKLGKVKGYFDSVMNKGAL